MPHLLVSTRELPNPKLELYDLDDAFSSEKARLAQVTNKCTDDDLVLFCDGQIWRFLY